MQRQLPEHQQCFGCGTSDDGRIQVEYFWDDDTREAVAAVHFGPHAQGPPHHVHGGALATVIDECLGTAAWLSGHLCVAANLNINYKQMTPINSTCQVTSRVSGVEGRKVRVHAIVTNEQNDVLAEADGLFVTLPPEKFGDKIPGLHTPISEYRQKLDALDATRES